MDPTTSPSSYDSFTLNGQLIPGIAEIISGGDIERDIQDQTQPQTGGANTVVRQRKNMVITYGIRMWTAAHFAALGPIEAMLVAGDSQTPVASYAYVDNRRPRVTKVVWQTDAALKTQKPGGPWQRVWTFHEYNRPTSYGGAVKPPQNAVEKAIADVSAQNAMLNKQLADMTAALQAAARAGK
jgi:hypothetical protein